ncbi:MAG: hypothetical protein ACRDC6_11305 [Shewanella sp.]
MKAREWLERGLERNDPIDLFTDAWRGFNNLFYIEPGHTERDKINSYLSTKVNEKVAQELIEGHKTEIEYLVSQPVIDMRGNGRNTAESINEFNISGSNLEKLQALFKIIYQVRCNLEHGQKSPTRERDIKLCSSSWSLVAEVVDKNS